MAGLLIRNRKALLVGRRLALATPGCIARCCGGCPLWRLLAACNTSPSCNGTPPILNAWICATVTCTNGSPLGVGQVVSIDGLCWTVTPQTATRPGNGDLVITGTNPVQCVSGCDDPACPTPATWYRGVPCSPSNPEVWFCGITQCGIYRTQWGCYKVDPALGGGTPPIGANTASGGTLYANCCACEVGCSVCPLVEGTITNPACFPAGLTDRTCCRSANACLRVQLLRGTQTFDPAPFQQPSRIVNEAINYRVGPGGIQIVDMQNTRTIDGTDFVTVSGPYTIGGCGYCPSLSLIPDRTLMANTFTQGVYTEDCTRVDVGGGPGQIDTTWQNTWECSGQTHRSVYRYNAGNRIITTTFEYAAVIEDADGGTCEGRCVGRGSSAAKRDNAGGCTGCGQSLGL